MNSEREKSRRFYEEHVAPMIHKKFSDYENRIAVGIAGEGSDCFGYDDFMSRDHDFGTGVCLWLTEEDFQEIGCLLSIAYNEIAQQYGGDKLTERLQERRGVMTSKSFYSNILYIDCDMKSCTLSEMDWLNLEHSCLATAVNGEVFRDDLGEFSNYRKMLLEYYPDSIWRRRLANELHQFSAAFQVNYGRCMSRNDLVAAELCRAKGIEAAMELFFLLNKAYAPYYKWTYRALKEMDTKGEYSKQLLNLSKFEINDAPWRNYSYTPNGINFKDNIVSASEKLAALIVTLLKENDLIKGNDSYLEIYVNEVLSI